MKKIVLNISDVNYEKFRFEAIHEKKSVADVIKERILTKPFHEEVEQAYDAWLTLELEHMMQGE